MNKIPEIVKVLIALLILGGIGFYLTNLIHSPIIYILWGALGCYFFVFIFRQKLLYEPHGGAIGGWSFLILLGIFLWIGDYLDSVLNDTYSNWAIFLIVILAGFLGKTWLKGSSVKPSSTFMRQISNLKATAFGMILGISLWRAVYSLFPDGYTVQAAIVMILIIAAFFYGLIINSKKEKSESSNPQSDSN